MSFYVPFSLARPAIFLVLHIALIVKQVISRESEETCDTSVEWY